MSHDEAVKVARLVLTRARAYRCAVALFMVGGRLSIVRANGDRFERMLFRCPAGPVGVYTSAATVDAIVQDVQAVRVQLVDLDAVIGAEYAP